MDPISLRLCAFPALGMWGIEHLIPLKAIRIVGLFGGKTEDWVGLRIVDMPPQTEEGVLIYKQVQQSEC